ncbi:type IV conjugative transfer system lipoprotein TraV [Pelobacter propionicus]|nr:type IV conjugative transfer system lipoprotein TraV [Pelobacter propionicus]
MKKVLAVIGMLAMGGCTLLNPYESSFSCPETSNGKCVSVQTAYKESAVGPGNPNDPVPEHKEDDCGTDNAAPGSCTDIKNTLSLNPQARENAPYSRYQSALFEKFSGLLKEPVTPIVAPPKTMRVLLLPYTGQDNEFYMLRYVYFFVDEPRWLLDGSVMSGEEE